MRVRQPAIGLTLCLAVAFQIACSSAPTYAGGDGLSQATAVRIIGALTAQEISAAQLSWLAGRYPDSKPEWSASRYILSTALYQTFPVALPDGSTTKVFFEITLKAK